MSTTICQTCGGTYQWNWEDAFDKFGFDDGDGQVMTDTVAEALRDDAYTVAAEPWGFHNVVITSIKKGDRELIPPTAVIGYDNPRHYLPLEIIDLLDKAFGDERKEVA